MALRIAFYADSGSPIGVIPPDVYGRGIGAAELALVSLTEALARRGHEVRVYNDPVVRGTYRSVSFHPRSWFDSSQTDIFVLFRVPWVGLRYLRCPKLFWSCDQQTAGNYATDIFPFVDYTVCISPYHRDYHIRRYGVHPDRIGYIDLGVRLEDYPEDYPDRWPKVPGRCIYCSVPQRGLDILAQAWPLIKERVPHASLVITADSRLWGVPYAGDELYRALCAGLSYVQYLGKVPRSELCREQLKAEVMAYPADYEELFCVSAAECQVAGAVPVTSSEGALTTTVEGGIQIGLAPRSSDFVPAFVDAVVELLCNKAHREELARRGERLRDRFDWNRIAQTWEELAFRLINGARAPSPSG